MAFCIVVLNNLGKKVIYASILKQKSFSKVIRLINILLAIGLVSLIFADKNIDRH